jgi:hypothetical protein
MIGENMKTEITIDGITYKVGDVLERDGCTDREITAMGINNYFFINPDNNEFSREYYDGLQSLENWKIKKPKKKIVVERWFNIYNDGSASTFKNKENADKLGTRDRIACEYVKFEYKIDEK